MNLLMISGDRALASGKQGPFYNTLEELHKHFDRIDIICPRASVQRFHMMLFGNVYVHPSPWPLLLQPLWIYLQGKKLVATYHHQLATVHEYPPFYNGIGARLLSSATRIPYVLEIHHVPGWPRASDIKERLYRWFLHFCIAWDAQLARAVRAVHTHQTPDFLVAAGVPRAKITIIPSFYIDLTIFKPGDVRASYDIAFVGRMATNKGLDIFLDVMERTGLVAVAVGDGPLLSWARAQAKRRGLKIHFPGFVKESVEVASYLHESRVLVMPSFNEGGPRVVLEAMACGLPVVATPVGIVPEVLPPEAIEEWNPRDIADKVKNILNDAVLYDRLRTHGLAMAKNFEREQAIRGYADALKRIATTV